MFVPSGFLPSNATTKLHYDEEGRLRQTRIGGRSEDGGVGEANSLYATEAELFGSCAPFLKRAKIRDARRRNYIIQPGGACIYFDTQKVLDDPYGNGKVQFTGPSDKESFGHNSMDGTKMPNSAAVFTVGGDKGAFEPHK